MSHSGNNPSSGSGDYERPNNRYRCGRAAAWGKPCANGPTGGHCGGVNECQPVLRDGKFECRRPSNAGGPCKEGPKADGACSHTHPPCIPRLTLRGRRGRRTWQLCLLLSLLLAAGFHFGRKGNTYPITADPGPLSAKHATFTTNQGCATCHAAHSAGLDGLAKAVFHHDDMTGQCVNCHKFDGFARQPHNDIFDTNPNANETDCRQCHTEHRGAMAKITTIADAQCNFCHKVKMERFDKGHPDFPASFPHITRGDIKFDHAKHLLQHFKQSEYTARAQQTCAECHAASPGEHEIRTASFDNACARCHADQISQNELVLLRLPEPTTNAAAITTDDATAFMAWLLQREGGTNYGMALTDSVTTAAKDGILSLAKNLDAQPTPSPSMEGRRTTGARLQFPSWEGSGVGSSVGSQKLLAGLSPELLSRPSELWLKGEKFEPPALKAQSGWYWMEDLYPELHYKPAEHADPVARAWLEFVLTVATHTTNATDMKRAVTFRDELTNLRSGVGRCIKCHAISAPASLPTNEHIDWGYSGSQLPAHTKFSHGKHLAVAKCEDCHALNSEADYEGQFKDSTTAAGVSNFKSIALANCTSCHAQKKVRNDCALCHQYHREPSLNEIAVSK